MARLPHIRRPLLTPLALAASASGSGPAWVGAAGLMISLYLHGWTGIPRLGELLGAMLGALVSLLAGLLLKRLVGRPRPYHALAGHRALGRRPRDASMPSTHACTSVALAAGLLSCAHPLALPALPWAGAVVFSRYYLGLHYPSDLAAGAALGLLLGLQDWTPAVTALLG